MLKQKLEVNNSGPLMARGSGRDKVKEVVPEVMGKGKVRAGLWVGF